MSSISKVSSRSSSSSGFSSTIHEPFALTSTLQTVVDIQRADINARAVFCGEQDCRLNELRRMTGAIIDLNVVQNTNRPFERVNWTIFHCNTEVRDFIIRRLNHWSQQTQILCDMAYADMVFLQEKQNQQIEKPPPLTTVNFGRRNRTQSLTQSATTNFYPIRNQMPSTPTASSYKRELPFTGLLGRTLLKLDPRFNDNEKLFKSKTDIRQAEEIVPSCAADHVDITPIEISQLVKTAKWAGLLSDTSENELNENRVCFADTVSVSKLAEILKNNELKPTSDVRDIDNIIQQSTMNVTSREQIRKMDGKKYWFHRVILDGHIQFPVGISQDASEARRLAYRQMVAVCLNEGGVKMKMLIANRVKVVKGPKLQGQHRPTHDELDMNGTQVGFQTNTNNDESTTPLSSEYTANASYGNNSSSLSTLFSTLTSPFRPSHKTLISYKNRPNGTVKHDNDNLIYHQLDIHRINDENSNEKNNNMTNNSILIDIPGNYSNDLLIDADNNKHSNFLTLKESFIWIILASLLYFIWFIFIAGISIVHILIYLALLISYILSERTRRFALAILIYLTYLLLYDALRLIPNYTVSTIHIEDIYLIEKKLFGIVKNGHMMTLNEYFQQNHIPLLDVFTGLCYLNWIPIPLIYSLYLYRYKSKRDYMDFAFTFLLTNLLGFVVYYIIPAAPPWYVELYGFEFNLNVPGNAAGFIHFDQITGLKVFSSMYSKNANVFAAIPSLHAAYPLITVLYGSLSKKLWLHIGFVFFTFSVWFSAVYSRHHYVLDVIAGGMCALTAFILYRLLCRIPTIN
ncbi:unnamed protein product, partial [Rotaria magnacalcarata]